MKNLFLLGLLLSFLFVAAFAEFDDADYYEEEESDLDERNLRPQPYDRTRRLTSRQLRQLNNWLATGPSTPLTGCTVTVAPTTGPTITVYFHDVYNGTANTQITQTDITGTGGQMDVLTADFAVGGSPITFSFGGYSSTTTATNSTWWGLPGPVDRTEGPEYDMKKFFHTYPSTLAYDPTVLHVYITDVDNDTLGWATWPQEYNREGPTEDKSEVLDGIVISWKAVKAAGAHTGQNSLHSAGHVLSHLVGKWLGLLDICQQSCGTSSTQGTTGDYVSDTVPCVVHHALVSSIPSNTTCPFVGAKWAQSCPAALGTEMKNNVMDLRPDSCVAGSGSGFTAGQITRARQGYNLRSEIKSCTGFDK